MARDDRDDTARERDFVLDRGASRPSAGTDRVFSEVIYDGRHYTVSTIGGEGMHVTVLEDSDVSE